MTELKSFDRVAHLYDETRGMPPQAAAAVTRGILDALAPLGTAPRLYECGIGTGRIAVPLAEAGVRITGLDISPKMLAILRGKRRDIDVALAEVARPPLRAGAFDAALFVHILHLVPDATATVEAALGLVRRGGIMVHGRDDSSAGSRREDADGVVRRIVRELTGIEMPGWSPYDRGEVVFDEVIGAVGGTVTRTRVAEWESTTTAAQFMERVGRRDFSSAWLIPDESLEEVLARVRPEVEAIFGGPQTPHSTPRSFSLQVARLP